MYTSFASAGWPVRALYTRTRENIDSTASAACLLACLLAFVVAWLPYRILTHIHVHRHAAAHKYWLGYPRSERPVLFMVSDLSKRERGYRYPECIATRTPAIASLEPFEHELLRGKNFTESSNIWLDTDLKIILLDHQNNFVGTLKVMSNAAKNFDILTTSYI